MSGEKNLNRLLRKMAPVLNPGVYVFCTVGRPVEVPEEYILGLFQEKEGKTLILEQSVADRLGWEYSFQAAWITLQVHSALEAVGLTAAVATALAQAEIPCNVVAGFYHDHLFVPFEKSERAMKELQNLSGDGGNV